MGKKIFVSYKYADSQVENLNSYQNSTVRDYVNEFENKLVSSDNIYKGEHEGEDISQLTDEQIWEQLKDRIYDSSVTVIFISPGMKEIGLEERDQWIPWEVSYSLKETSRRNQNGDPITSRSNAMIAVILPDETGSYEYYLESRNCCDKHCRMHHIDQLFGIIKANKFNRIRNETKRVCDNGDTVWTGTCSYIEAVKWSDFISSYQMYLDKAKERQDNIDEYKIRKEMKG